MTSTKTKKGIVIFIYTTLIIIVWSSYFKPNIFVSITLQNITNVLLYIVLTIIVIMLWLLVTFQLLSNFIQRYRIQKNIENAEQSLEVIANAKLISYKPKNNGAYITLKFRSNGATSELWEQQRKVVQSVINYTILGDIEHDKKNWDIIIINVRKGRHQKNEKDLNDEL